MKRKKEERVQHQRSQRLLLFVFIGMMGMVLAKPSEAKPEADFQIDTLENQAVLSGEAEPGCEVRCQVYNYDERGRKAVLYQTEEVVGASGFYAITASLPVLGRQYVRLQVIDPDALTKEAIRTDTLYAYTRYRKQLVNDLQNYYLNIYEVLERSGA